MSLSKTARKVISLSQAIRRYWDTELPKRHPSYPLIRGNENSGPAPPESDRLKALLESLQPDDVYRLILIMYLGRGDFGTDDLAQQFQAMKETFEKPEYAIRQMIGKGPLATYLTDGLSKLKAGGIDPDRLTFRTAKVTRK